MKLLPNVTVQTFGLILTKMRDFYPKESENIVKELYGIDGSRLNEERKRWKHNSTLRSDGATV